MANSLKYVSAEIGALAAIIDELNATFESGKTLDIEWRKEQLRSLWRMLDVRLRTALDEEAKCC